MAEATATIYVSLGEPAVGWCDEHSLSHRLAFPLHILSEKGVSSGGTYTVCHEDD